MRTENQEHPAPAIGPDSLKRLRDHDVLTSVLGTKPGDHICVLYDYSPVEQLPAVIQFLKEGLEQGEQCVYLTEEVPEDHLLKWFKTDGIDVARERERGALLIWTREAWRQPGILDSIRKAAQVREIIDAAFAAGFTGVRFAVEMTWTLNPDIPAKAIEAWESMSNRLLGGGMPVQAMCLYGRRRLSSETMEAGLKTHPLVLDGKGLRSNEGFLGPDSPRGTFSNPGRVTQKQT